MYINKMSVGLPSKLLYQTKIEGAAARSFRSNIQPQNGTGNYNPGDTIIINIPTRANLVLAPSESYLKFNVSFVNGPVANDYIRFDSAGAAGLIQSIKVFHGSNVISDINNNNFLAKIMMDIQLSTDATYGKMSVVAGTRSDLTCSVPSTAGSVYSVNQTNSGSRFKDNNNKSGKDALIPAYDPLITDSGKCTQTFCINLMSIVGSLCAEKYLPLFAMTSSPLKVEIQLVNNPNIAVCSKSPLSSFLISNCEYIAQMIELSDSAMSTILAQSGGGPLQFVFNDFRNFSSTSNGVTNISATTQYSVPIAAKYSSLKSIYIGVRASETIGALTYFPMSSNTFNIQEYFFRLGASVVPSKSPNTKEEMFEELMKSIASISDINHHPSIDNLSYNQIYPLPNDETATNVGVVSSGSFYIGLDLENYSGADRSTIFAGYNSNTDDIYFNPTFGPTTTSRSLRFETYALFDSVLVCENNTCYVKY
jgi:hypothetical protein